jgi:hypothetical protein
MLLFRVCSKTLNFRHIISITGFGSKNLIYQCERALLHTLRGISAQIHDLGQIYLISCKNNRKLRKYSK